MTGTLVALKTAAMRTILIVAAFLLAVALLTAMTVDYPSAQATTPIDDLSVSGEELLQNCSHVAKIDVRVKAFRPTHRIIQIDDSHFLPRERYRGQFQPPSEEGYTEYLGAVDRLQASQLRLLIWLADKHGLREVFSEAVSAENIHRYIDWIGWRRENKERAAGAFAASIDLRQELQIADNFGKDVEELNRRLRGTSLLRDLILVQGAVVTLIVDRPSIKLLPVEDQQARHAASRAYRRGRSRGPENDRRQTAIVQNLLQHGPCSVIILGYAHDLSEQINRLGGGKCEYIRVVPKQFPRMVESEGRRTWISE